MKSNQSFFQRNRKVLRTFGHVWTLPNTVLGMLLGTGRNIWKVYDGSIEICLGDGLVRQVCNRLGISAFTLGDCVLYVAAPCENLRWHEGRHTQQYRLLGPFFLPVYFILLALMGYHNHPLERDARDWEFKQCGSLYMGGVSR